MLNPVLRRLGLLTLCGAWCTHAQNPTSPQASKTAPVTTLSVTTRLVQVAVVVHDRNGKSVRGLALRDFTVLDQGVPQTIAHFSEVAEQPPAPSPAPLALNVFSNRFEDIGPAPANAVVLPFAQQPALRGSSADAGHLEFPCSYPDRRRRA